MGFTIEEPKFSIEEPGKDSTSKFTVEEPKKPGIIDKAAEAGSKAEFIGTAPSFASRALGQAQRKSAIIPEILIGDVPFLRQMPAIKEFEPSSGLEKLLFGTGRFARDIAVTSKIAPLKGLKFLGAAGAFGAATAASEEPADIAKRAAGTAALFKAVDVGAKYIPKVATAAYKKLPKSVQDRFAQVGQSIGLSIKKIGEIENMKFKRYSDIKIAQIEGENIARNLEANLTKQEREVLPFLIEKTGIPKKLQRPDLIEAIRNPERRKVLQSFAGQLKQTYDDFHKQLVEVYGDDVGFIKNYMNRLWDIPKNKEKQVFNWFMTKTQHTKPRLISTVQEGINKFDLTPKSLDAAELFRIYNNNVSTAMANMSFLKQLNKLKMPGGQKAIMRIDKAPDDFITIDHPVLRRALAIPIKGGSEEKLLLNKVPVKVHPEIADEIKTIFGSRLQGDFVRAVEGINAFAKYSQLTLSMFHHIALAESAIATSVFNPKVILKTIKDMKQGKRPILSDPLVKEWIPAGLQVGAPTDVHRNLLETSLMAAEDNIKKGFAGKIPLVGSVAGKIASQPVKLLRKAVEFNNRYLWDYYHPQLKVYAANKLYKDALRMPKYANLPETQVKREIAQFVNDTFGGQSWELMTKSPQWQQGMHALLLSPDWAISTVRQALSPFQVGARSEATAALRAELGSNFWKSGALTMFASINNLNRSFSRFYLGQDRDMWDNDPGHQTHLFIGFNPDGSKRWLRWGKQFRELPEFFIKDGRFAPLGAPIKKIEGKLSPFIQATKEQFRPFPHGDLGKAVGTKREEVERIKQLARTFLPFSAQNMIRKGEINPVHLAFPVSGSRGSVYYNSLSQFEEAIRDNDKNRIRNTYRAAVENGINADALLKRAVGNVEYETNRTKKQVDDVFNDILTLPREQWRQYIDSQNLDDRAKRRLSRMMRERLKAENMMEEINKNGINQKRLDAILGK